MAIFAFKVVIKMIKYYRFGFSCDVILIERPYNVFHLIYLTYKHYRRSFFSLSSSQVNWYKIRHIYEMRKKNY